MKHSKTISVVASLAVAGLVLLSAPAAEAQGREALPTVVSVNGPKVFPARNQAARTNVKTSNLTYHGGPVMTTSVAVTAIYWGPGWAGSSFTSDKVTGLTSLYSQYGNSPHAGISTQYTQSNGAKTSIEVRFSNSLTDSATAASSATSSVFDKVVSAVGFPNLSNDGYYPVYTDIPRGTAGYCAWHSAGTVTSGGVSKTIKFAFFFSLDGDSGCDPNDTRTLYSQGTEALANVTIHELAEAMTDPQLNAWFDKQGYENADKCAWQFSTTPVYLAGDTAGWKLQGEWDNSKASCQW